MSEVAKEELPKPSSVPISLFTRRGNKTTQLINNQKSDFSVEGKHRWFSFDFVDAVFAKQIRIETTGYDSWNKFEFVYAEASGEEVSQSIGHNEGACFVNIGKVIKWFKFRPQAKFSMFNSQSINKVSVDGYTLENFKNLEDAINNIDENAAKLSERLERLKTRETESSERVSNLTNELESVNKIKIETDSKVGQESAKLESLQNGVNNLIKSKAGLVSDVDDLKAELTAKQSERRGLLKETQVQQKELEKIKQEIRLFPSEISGFVKEGRRAIVSYIWLSIPFVLIIGYVTYTLFLNAENLLPLYKEDGFNIWTVFLTRLPFVIVAVVILEVCGSIVRRFINEVVQINKQRLNLSKLSIIARDVTAASSSDLELSEMEKYELQTYLKMELLRAHIKDYVGDDYNPKQGKVASLISQITNPKPENGPLKVEETKVVEAKVETNPTKEETS